jgi:hypothetical protein
LRRILTGAKNGELHHFCHAENSIIFSTYLFSMAIIIVLFYRKAWKLHVDLKTVDSFHRRLMNNSIKFN